MKRESEIEKAKKLLEKEQAERAKKCADEVNDVLNKYGFQIVSGNPILQPK